MTEPVQGPQILVQVMPVGSDRQITWGANRAEDLMDRLADIRAAIVRGSEALAEGLADLPSPVDWEVREVTGTFGLSLSAEAGVILSKASAETTFEVSVTFQRR